MPSHIQLEKSAGPRIHSGCEHADEHLFEDSTAREKGMGGGADLR